MRIERIIAESQSIMAPVSADRLIKDNKQTITAEAVSLDADRRQQANQNQSEEKELFKEDTLEDEIPSEEKHEGKSLGKHIDVVV